MVNLSRFISLRIVIVYAIVSAIYIFTSDYFLHKLITDIDLISRYQTYKGIGFIFITSWILYILVKKNIDTKSNYYREITEIKQKSDNHILRSKEEYMTLFNQSPLPKWIIDIDTRKFVLVNEPACSIYGYTHEEYANMTLGDIRPKEDIPLMEEIIRQSLENENYSFPKTIRHKKKNGEIIHAKVKSCVLTFEGKKVMLASAVDVTAEIEIQNKLIETNSKLQLASEIAGLGYWTNDLIKSEINWSDELFKIFELDPKTFTLTFENIKNRFHPDDQSNFELDFYEKLDDKSLNEVERRILTPNGQEKWILERQYHIKDSTGNTIRLEGIALDITSRKLHEKELLESNERFKILAKATVESIVDWDIKNKTIFWGEGFHSIMGYDLSQYNSRLWSDNIHPDDKEKILDEFNKILENKTQQYFNTEYRFLKANKEVAYLHHKGILIRDKNGEATRIVTAMTDVTDSLERMHKIELQNKKLKDISWTQSHVVRAPLANLMGLITLLQENVDSNEPSNELIELIGDSAKKLDNIIREIVKKTNEIENS